MEHKGIHYKQDSNGVKVRFRQKEKDKKTNR